MIAAAFGTAAVGYALPAHAERIYASQGLTAKATLRRGNSYYLVSPSTRYEVRFKGKVLCGEPELGRWLYPEGPEWRWDRGHYCPTQVTPLGDAGLIVMFSSSGESVPARVSVSDGELRIERFAVSDDPRRDSISRIAGGRMRLPGWTRLTTDWYETVLIRHTPYRVFRLGEGHLLDVEDSIAYLVVEPGRHGARTDRQAAGLILRAVNLDDARELARLAPDPCLRTPRLKLDSDGFGTRLPDTLPEVSFEAVPGWRKRTLDLDGETLRLLDAHGLVRLPGCETP